MLSPTAFHRIYRLSALYDLVLSAPFALAPSAFLVWAGLGAISQSLGMMPPAPLDAHAMLFANFFGSIVTLWSLLRLKLDQAWLARWDAIGRGLFSLAMLVALSDGASPLLWGALVAEVLWGLVQVLPVAGRPWRSP